MDLRFYEKLSILVVLFIGVTIGTAFIIGNYNGLVQRNRNVTENRIILN